MQIIHSLLWGVATPGKLGSSSSQAFMFFIFDLFKSIMHLLTEFHDTFSISYKILPYYVTILLPYYYYHIFIIMLPYYYHIKILPYYSCCSHGRRLGKHYCMSSSFSIVILNDTFFFPTVQLQVHKREFGARWRCQPKHQSPFTN